MTKIVIISDTHNQHERLSIPEGDILLHAGDLSVLGKYEKVEKFLHWMEWLPHTHKIFIAGNHDLLFEDNPTLARQLLDDVVGVTYLQDSSVTVEGLKIWGSPWTPRFYDWAFNVDAAMLHRKWENIPEDTDIIMTHGPANGIGDRAPRNNGIGFEHTGCPDLKRKIIEINPTLHVFGHIHEDYGIYDSEGKNCIFERPKEGTLFVNACSLDGHYKRIRAPIVIDLEEE